MMEKKDFANKLLKLCTFLSSLSLLFLMHVSPMYADPDPKDSEMNMMKEHIEKARHKYPELDKKAMEIEEKLRTGTPVKECCINCHYPSSHLKS